MRLFKRVIISIITVYTRARVVGAVNINSVRRCLF